MEASSGMEIRMDQSWVARAASGYAALMIDSFTTHSAEETIAFGRALARELEPPKLVLLRGDLGAGKTTLMMTIAGILSPRRGSIRLDGSELVGLSPARIVARGVALVPENRLVFPQMSVRENLLAGAYQRRDKAEIAADIERMFNRFPRLRERY